MRYLVVDGMLSGTGVRDAIEGGYLDLCGLGISSDIAKEVSRWQARYEHAHFVQFADVVEVAFLDAQGLSICERLMDELPDAKIGYFSAAEMRTIPTSHK